MKEPNYIGANGRMDSVAAAWLLHNDHVFFRGDQIIWADGHHDTTGAQLNAGSMDSVPLFMGEYAMYTAGVLDVMRALETDDGLRVSRELIAPALHQAIREGDLTGITLFNLFACGQALGIEKYGADDYAVTYDERLACGIPSFYRLICRLVWDMRAYNGLTSPFSVSFDPANVVAANAYLGTLREAVRGAELKGACTEQVSARPEVFSPATAAEEGGFPAEEAEDDALAADKTAEEPSVQYSNASEGDKRADDTADEEPVLGAHAGVRADEGAERADSLAASDLEAEDDADTAELAVPAEAPAESADAPVEAPAEEAPAETPAEAPDERELQLQGEIDGIERELSGLNLFSFGKKRELEALRNAKQLELEQLRRQLAAEREASKSYRLVQELEEAECLLAEVRARAQEDDRDVVTPSEEEAAKLLSRIRDEERELQGLGALAFGRKRSLTAELEADRQRFDELVKRAAQEHRAIDEEKRRRKIALEEEASRLESDVAALKSSLLPLLSAPFRGYGVGSVIEFGQRLSTTGDEAAEPIRWRVAELGEDYLILVSESHLMPNQFANGANGEGADKVHWVENLLAEWAFTRTERVLLKGSPWIPEGNLSEEGVRPAVRIRIAQEE